MPKMLNSVSQIHSKKRAEQQSKCQSKAPLAGHGMTWYGQETDSFPSAYGQNMMWGHRLTFHTHHYQLNIRAKSCQHLYVWLWLDSFFRLGFMTWEE
jgi:hypothetical protein